MMPADPNPSVLHPGVLHPCTGDRHSPARPALRRRLAEEHGSIAPLALVYTVIALAAALLLFGAADLYLERKQLYTHADAAALAAAGTYDIRDIETSDGPPAVVLDRDAALLAAQQHLDRTTSGEVEILAFEVRGDEVTLTLSGEWRPAAGGALLPVSVPVEVQVSARARLE